MADIKVLPQNIADSFRQLKNEIKSANGDIEKVYNNDKTKFLALHNEYIKIVAETIKQTIQKASLKKEDIKAIGFHGQTCYHNPPSISKENPNIDKYSFHYPMDRILRTASSIVLRGAPMFSRKWLCMPL